MARGPRGVTPLPGVTPNEILYETCGYIIYLAHNKKVLGNFVLLKE